MGISSVGIGSGLNVTDIVTQLIAIEQKPLTALQTKATTLSSQLSALGVVKSKVAALQDAATAIAKPEFWQKTSSSTSDTSISVSTTGNAASGSFAVSVSQIAKAQSLASTAFTGSTATVGAGKLRLELGSWDTGNAFTAKTGTSPIDVAIGADDTLATIRTKINDAKAGVTASIVNDGTGARLVIRSNTTGEESAMRISEVDDDGDAVVGGALGNAFGYDRAGTSAMSQTTAPQNAKAKINGLDLVSQSNTFSDVSDGFSFTAVKETTTDVQVTVGTDTATMKKALTAFTTAYNDLNNTLRTLTKYDDSTKVAGTLQGDSTAVGLMNQMRSMIQGTGGTSSAFSRLGDLGIALQRDGSLVTDDTKLTTALAKPQDVAKMMASTADALPAQRGVAAIIASFASTITGTGGSLSSRTDSLTSRIKTNGTEQDKLSDRIEDTRQRLLKQYQALDTKLSTLSSLNSYVTQQITQWNKSTS